MSQADYEFHLHFSCNEVYKEKFSRQNSFEQHLHMVDDCQDSMISYLIVRAC